VTQVAPAGRPWAAYLAALSGVIATAVSVVLIQRQSASSVGVVTIDAGPSALAARPAPDAGKDAAAAAPLEFVLHLETEPPGAEVLDGEQRLGTTPLDIMLTNASVTREPKRFTLEKEGYVPLEYVQPRSDVARLSVTEPLDPLPHDRVAHGLGKVHRGISDEREASPVDPDVRRAH
jgi:serine/threonine-protein kinase